MEQHREVRPRPAEGQYLPAAIAALLGVIAYANAFGNPFVWDDTLLIANRPFLRDLANLPRLLAAIPSQDYFALSGEYYYRPLVTASYILDWAAWGGAPAGFHATNVTLHAAAAWLVFLVGARLADRATAMWAAILFAIHPIHTETVTPITGRVDLLPTVGVLVAFLAFLRARSEPNAWPWHCGGLVAFALALWSKEIAFTFPAVLAAWELHRARSPKLRNAIGAWRHHAPYWSMWAVYGYWRFGVLESPGATPPWVGGTPGTALMSTVPIIAYYVWLWVWPVDLSVFHNISIVPAPGDLRFTGSLTILLGLTYVAWRARERAPLAWLGWVAFFLLLTPVMNLVPMNNPVAERYLYLPTVALSLGTGQVLAQLAGGRRPVRVVALFLGVVLLVRTMVRNRDYASELNLYESAVAIADQNPQAHYHYGLLALRQGEVDTAGAAFAAAVELNPRHREAWAGLAQVTFLQGDASPALAISDRALRLWPDSWEVWYDRGMILIALQRPADAAAAFEEAAKHNPASLRVRLAQVTAYVDVGRLAEAQALACAEPDAAATELMFAEALVSECAALRTRGGNAR